MACFILKLWGVSVGREFHRWLMLRTAFGHCKEAPIVQVYGGLAELCCFARNGTSPSDVIYVQVSASLDHLTLLIG